jgi:hypothetical protein
MAAPSGTGPSMLADKGPGPLGPLSQPLSKATAARAAHADRLVTPLIAPLLRGRR